ncbi:rhomboid family intramembrane serine protease [Aureispira anguillae]|uniref:Rhomboid family intramembrane serine protease n=1 Tax=Aureispira anguillae TaxID=2864201 RepID=A0A916DWT5_9BACT|nr:rhomboid family intramembrane serine protease [Aureispira anguillae]BDS14336.1 rhomboid family intramembrane serine protease [Aureispira anguillae]
MALKIRYNSPVVLTFSLVCIAVYFADLVFSVGASPESVGPITSNFFMLPGNFDWANPMNYVRLLSYTMGHANQAHIMGNMSIFLLIAPIMEEKYGSRRILLMMVLTALITGVLQIMLFSSGLLGASGIVFMFIVLVSFADVRKGTIPLTFILVVLFFIGQEVVHSLQDNQVSEYAHIMGGIMGGIFGMFFKENQPSINTSNQTVASDLLDN